MQVRQTHRLPRGGRGHGQQSLVRRIVLEVVDRGHAAGTAGQRRMGGDVLYPLAHQPHTAPVPEALQILFSPTYGHILTSRRIPVMLGHPAAVACTATSLAKGAWSVPGAMNWLRRTPAHAWPLLPRRTVGDGLPYRRIHFLRRNQHDGLKLHRTRGVHRQGERGGGHTIRHVGNDEKIVAAIGIIKGFEGAPESLYQLCYCFAPFRSTLA